MFDKLSDVWDYVDSLGVYYRPHGGASENGVRPSKEWVKEQLWNRAAAERNNHTLRHAVNGCVAAAGHKLLTPRLRTLSSPSPSSSTEAVNADPQQDSQLYKISPSDYRRLTNQIQETNARISNGFKGQSHNRLRLHSGATPNRPGRSAGGPEGMVYKSQLASSIKAFQSKTWVPYEAPDNVSEQRTVSRCCSRASSRLQSRPVSSRSISRPSTGKLSEKSEEQQAHLQIRPTSREDAQKPPYSEDEGQRPLSSLHSYDNLDPDLVFELSGGLEAESVYGDRPDSVFKELNDLIVDDGDDDDEEEKDDEDEQSKNEAKDSDDSDEDYPEPTVDDVNLADAPDLNLRPEKLDSLHVPEMKKGDRRKYDFDASKVLLAEYKFSQCLSDEVFHVDLLKDCVVEGKAWRDLAEPSDEDEALMMDRLVELCRLDMKTSEWEASRREKQRIAKQRQTAKQRTGRIFSAKSWREKRCCLDCLQLLCNGDCPEKRSKSSLSCNICRETGCPGNCSENAYTIRSRHEREPGDIFEDKPRPRPKLRPRSCTSCQKRHNAKLINANNIVLGRPVSGHATFTYGQVAYKPNKDLRPNSRAEITPELEQSFDKLGLDPCKSESKDREKEDLVEHPETACSHGGKRIRGRASSLPHKSFFSQRRHSLTEQMRERMRIAAIRRRSSAAAKRKRPKTSG